MQLRETLLPIFLFSFLILSSPLQVGVGRTAGSFQFARAEQCHKEQILRKDGE